MILFHGSWRRRAMLLASGVLEAGEAAGTRAHLEACASCRAAHDDAAEALSALAADPARAAEPEVPLPALVTRVRARIAEEEARPRRPSLRPALLLAAAAAALMALGVALWPRPSPQAPVAEAPAAGSPDQAGLPEELLRRLERQVAREQTARYLTEAQDVLVTVAAQPRPCDRKKDVVDVSEEARRSRELLARRALVVDVDLAAVASAGPVLEDVETMLREVAALESCARSRDLDEITRQMERKRLLMKIDLMTRELQG